jgi:hypothetical protein
MRLHLLSIPHSVTSLDWWQTIAKSVSFELCENSKPSRQVVHLFHGLAQQKSGAALASKS